MTSFTSQLWCHPSIVTSLIFYCDVIYLFYDVTNSFNATSLTNSSYCVTPYVIASRPILLRHALCYCVTPYAIASRPMLLRHALCYCVTPYAIASRPMILRHALCYCVTPYAKMQILRKKRPTRLFLGCTLRYQNMTSRGYQGKTSQGV